MNEIWICDDTINNTLSDISSSWPVVRHDSLNSLNVRVDRVTSLYRPTRPHLNLLWLWLAKIDRLFRLATTLSNLTIEHSAMELGYISVSVYGTQWTDESCDTLWSRSLLIIHCLRSIRSKNCKDRFEEPSNPILSSCGNIAQQCDRSSGGSGIQPATESSRRSSCCGNIRIIGAARMAESRDGEIYRKLVSRIIVAKDNLAINDSFVCN